MSSTADTAVAKNRRLMSISAASTALGMSWARVKRAVVAGQLPAVKIGDRYMIPEEQLDMILGGTKTVSTN